MDKFSQYVRLFLEGANKKPDADGDGVPDWVDKHPGKDDNAKKKTSSGKTDLSKVPPQLRKHVKKKAGIKEGKVPPQLAPFVKKKKADSKDKKSGKMPPQLAKALKKKQK